uniref:Uncharacterized protein n=1 Tax=Megaselia scalaris TaxID=36166 RepID=T1H214_MEGSC
MWFALALQKHVNQHFNAMDNKEGSNKRTSDPPVPKVLKKNGKKLKYRRTPFSGKFISDEWVPKDSPAKKKFTKTVKMKTLQPKEKLAADRLIQSTYRNIQRPKEPLCLDILKPTQEQIQTTASNAPQIQEETCSVK